MSAPTEEVFEAIGKKIRFLLHNQAVTAARLSSEIGVTKDYLKDVLGGRAKPTRHLLNKVCAFFNVKSDFFGAEVNDILWEDPEDDSEDGGDFDFESASGSGGKSKRRKRKFDLAELAAHHQALLECLVEKRVIDSASYNKKVEDVRRRTKLEE
jgi:transcriptional regulator with XRE-family HTH domain